MSCRFSLAHRLARLQDAGCRDTFLACPACVSFGPIAKPRQILVVAELPKTRSGKIMRRLLRDVAENR